MTDDDFDLDVTDTEPKDLDYEVELSSDDPDLDKLEAEWENELEDNEPPEDAEYLYSYCKQEKKNTKHIVSGKVNEWLVCTICGARKPNEKKE